MLFCDHCGWSEQKRRIYGLATERYECGHILCDGCAEHGCPLCLEEADSGESIGPSPLPGIRL